MEENIQEEFKKELGLLDGTMLVVGSMIGSGIFIVSADIARQVGSAGWLTLIWLVSGIITMIAAVSYGELSAMFPKAGGQYVYLKEAYNKLIAFLYGWSFFRLFKPALLPRLWSANNAVWNSCLLFDKKINAIGFIFKELYKKPSDYLDKISLVFVWICFYG
jgi:amino acid transporter